MAARKYHRRTPYFTLGRQSIICALALAGPIACAGAPKPDPRALSYGAELHACVDRAETREEYEACKAEVNARYGRDGGAK